MNPCFARLNDISVATQRASHSIISESVTIWLTTTPPREFHPKNREINKQKGTEVRCTVKERQDVVPDKMYIFIFNNQFIKSYNKMTIF